ncbi:MAG: hypothetical protein HZR80_20960 [Candidatus Heimdallarchaeota archaeon]
MFDITFLEDQKGIFEVLLLFDDNSQYNLSEIGRKTTLGRMAVRNSVDRLLGLGLIEPAPAEKLMERKVRLSENGKKVIPHLKEINNIIMSQQNI